MYCMLQAAVHCVKQFHADMKHGVGCKFLKFPSRGRLLSFRFTCLAQHHLFNNRGVDEYRLCLNV